MRGSTVYWRPWNNHVHSTAIKTAEFDTQSDIGKQAVKCIEAGFPSDKKSKSFGDLISEINKLKTELKTLCVDLLELKPTKAITFEPCKEFY